jgi:hypothetical protein
LTFSLRPRQVSARLALHPEGEDEEMLEEDSKVLAYEKGSSNDPR